MLSPTHPAAHLGWTEPAPAAAVADALNAAFADRSGQEALREAITGVFKGRLALVSSFGAESAILLHMVAQIDPATPVLFIDTDKLFPETRAYRDALIERLGLTGVRSIGPDDADVTGEDPDGDLWQSAPDRCCDLRKVRPLERALTGFSAWITGRKRFQSADRADISLFEADGERIKVNPLAHWTPEQVRAYVQMHDLPPHPLVAQGYPSIGCIPCTSRVEPGEDARSGRWRGQEKSECGIHFSNGRVVRSGRIFPAAS